MTVARHLLAALALFNPTHSLLGQELGKTEFLGTLPGLLRQDSLIYEKDDQHPRLIRTSCQGPFEFAVLDRKALRAETGGAPDSVFVYAGEGARARVLRATLTCTDSTLGPAGVSGSATPITVRVLGVLAHDREESRRSRRTVLVLDLATADQHLAAGTWREDGDGQRYRDVAVTRMQAHRIPSGLRADGCEAPLRLEPSRTNRGFGPRSLCAATLLLAPATPPVDRPTALAAADSLAALAVAFAGTLDTLSWHRAKGPAQLVRAFLATSPFPTSYAALELEQLLGQLALFAQGSDAMREMARSPYQPSASALARNVEKAEATRARLRTLAGTVP